MKRNPIVLVLLGWMAGAQSTQAAVEPGLIFSGDSQRSDVTHPKQSVDALSVEGQLRWSEQWNLEQSSYLDVRAFLSNEDLALRDEEVGRSAGSQSDKYLALRQLWWRYQPLNWTGFPGESLTVGLQRQQSEDSNWWDANLESLGWRLQTSTTKASLAVGERLDTYRTDDSELDPYDDHKLRVFGELLQDWRPYQALTGRFMYATQSGQDVEDFSTGDPQGVNGNWLWLGVGATSEWFNRRQHAQPWAYHLEWTWLQGEADFLPSSSTGSRNYDLNAWALDGGVRYDFHLPQRLAVGLQYAYGSGGADADSSDVFVQTGLNSNRQRFLGNRQSLYRLNDVLRADLSNLQQWSLFVGAEPLTDLELGAAFSWLRRNDASLPVYSLGTPLPVTLNGSNDIGQGADMVASWYFHSLLDNPQEGRVRLRGSVFETGAAFIDDGQWEHRWVLDLMLNF